MNRRIKKAIILAGGKGTRLKPFTNTSPKPMFPIHGIPFLEHLLKQVRSFGITDVTILLGYLAEVVTEHFGNGDKLGLDISYSITNEQNETQKRIYEARHFITSDFLLLYCDNYCPVDFEKMNAQFYCSQKLIQMTAYTNKDSYTKNNLFINEFNDIVVYDKTRTANNLNGVDIGYALIRHEVLNRLTDENLNFEQNIYAQMLKIGKLSAFTTDHRYYSIGSYERITQTQQFFSGKKVAFIDRDGTLNEKAAKAMYITKTEDFKWLDGAMEAIKVLNDSGFDVILITNQPGISRGMLSDFELLNIHRKMIEELEEIGAKINNIYICKHGWDDGCDCRKPKPGMLFAAQKDLNLDMRNAVFFGDDERDMQAAKAAGCKGILITDENRLIDAVKNFIKE